MFLQTLQLMLYGLAGVFAALAVLFASVCITAKLFPYKEHDG